MENKYTVEELTDITGLEIYLHKNGWNPVGIKSRYINTYNQCGRCWIKGDKSITIGLWGSPIRLGITHPVVQNMPSGNFESFVKRIT